MHKKFNHESNLGKVPVEFSSNLFLALQYYVEKQHGRSVTLSFKDFVITTLNDFFTDQNFSHILIFSIQFLESGAYQPIGSILFNKTQPVKLQNEVIENMIKMYIACMDLLQIKVVATISPPEAFYKGIIERFLGHKIPDDGNEIKYDAGGQKGIIHLYDLFGLQTSLMNIFKIRNIKMQCYDEDESDQIGEWSEVWDALQETKELKETKLKFEKNIQAFYTDHYFKENVLCALAARYSCNRCSRGTFNFVLNFSEIFKYFELKSLPLSYMISETWDQAIQKISTMKFRKTVLLPPSESLNLCHVNIEDNEVPVIVVTKSEENDKKKGKKNKENKLEDIPEENLDDFEELPITKDCIKTFQGIGNFLRQMLVDGCEKIGIISLTLSGVDNFANLIRYKNALPFHPIYKSDHQLVASHLIYQAVEGGLDGGSFELS